MPSVYTGYEVGTSIGPFTPGCNVNSLSPLLVWLGPLPPKVTFSVWTSCPLVCTKLGTHQRIAVSWIRTSCSVNQPVCIVQIRSKVSLPKPAPLRMFLSMSWLKVSLTSPALLGCSCLWYICHHGWTCPVILCLYHLLTRSAGCCSALIDVESKLFNFSPTLLNCSTLVFQQSGPALLVACVTKYWMGHVSILSRGFNIRLYSLLFFLFNLAVVLPDFS